MSMRLWYKLVLFAGIMLASGCGNSQDVPLVTDEPTKLLEQARSSLAAECFHVRTQNLGLPLAGSFDGDVSGERARGRLTLDGHSVDVVRIGDKAYTFLSKEYLQWSTGPKYPPAWVGKWIQNHGTGDLALPGSLTGSQVIQVLTPAGPVTHAGVATEHGRRIVTLRFKNAGGDDVALQVTDDGKTPTHIDVTSGGKKLGAVDVSELGRTCDIAAPAQVVDAP